MPRKSAASTSAAADLGASSTISSAAGASNVDGDTSIMSATTDVSSSTKPPKTSTKADKGDADNTGIDDLLLPRTLTSRLARGTLPPNTSIQKDALLALTKAASVFISYLAAHSNEVTTKKTIGPQDVLKAIQEIEMGSVMGLGEIGPDGKVGGRLERELEVWETVVRGKRKGYREKVKMRESGAGGEGRSSENDADGRSKEGEGEEREAKRARVEQEEGEDGDTGAGQSEGDYDQQQAMPPRPDDASHSRKLTNGTNRGKARNDLPDGDDEGEDDGYEDGSAEGDETQPDDEDEPEDEDEEPAPDDEEVDGYGPDDQLRHDMNGDETGDESE